MRVLSIIGERPIPPITAIRVRNHHLWARLAEIDGIRLKVLCLDTAADRDLGPARIPGVDEVDCEFFRPERPPLPARALAVYARSWHEYPRSAALRRRVVELEREWDPDVIHAEELRLAWYLPALQRRPSRAVQSVTFHNVESDLFSRVASPAVPLGRGLARRLQIASLKRHEAEVASRVDLPWAYSKDDLLRYRTLYPDVSWGMITNGTNVHGITPAPQVADRTVLILGSWNYLPNREGLAWFLEQIRPHLDEGVRITVAGSKADETIKRMIADAGLPFVDTPLDLEPLYAEAAVLAVPLLSGSGTRNKILESMAHERVVITTTKGAEGLEFGEAEGVVRADDPRDFARRLMESINSPESRADAARRGRQVVLDNYSYAVIARRMVEAWRARLDHGVSQPRHAGAPA